MTVKRLILIIITIITSAMLLLSLSSSLSQPQIQSRLELYQTNLILQAAEFSSDNNKELKEAIKTILGKDPYLNTQEQYEQVRKTTKTSQNNFQLKLDKLDSNLTANIQKNPDKFTVNSQTIAEDELKQQLNKALVETQDFLDELDLKIGIIQSVRGDKKTAIASWDKLIKNESSLQDLASVLKSLWEASDLSLTSAQTTINTHLDGWFRYQSLKQLYRVSKQDNSLTELEKAEKKLANQALTKLIVIATIPIFGGVVGIGLLVFLLAQLFIKKEQAILATNNSLTWETPWDWEIIFQVIIVGFFFIGQVVLPNLFAIVHFNPAGFSLRLKAIYILVSYLLMAGAGLTVLYFSLKSFFPLKPDWFRYKIFDNWVCWGFGGYLIALPMVVLVSLINQQIWQGQGGSNPLLSLALKSQDGVALAIFFFTAAVAAPIFEEIIFRGFLLASLTRYLPVWAAIIISGVIFAVAHLSFSEVLPLATLGIILGFVYTRSRNLLANIFLHSLWNSGTLLSLFILGSGS